MNKHAELLFDVFDVDADGYHAKLPYGNKHQECRTRIIEMLGDVLDSDNTVAKVGKAVEHIRVILEAWEKYDFAAEHCTGLDANDNPRTVTQAEKETLCGAERRLNRLLAAEEGSDADETRRQITGLDWNDKPILPSVKNKPAKRKRGK